jgi:transcription-repair coupling factor (superfamily II helicase)
MNVDFKKTFTAHQQIVLKDFHGASLALALAKCLKQTQRMQLIIVEDSKQAENLLDELSFFGPKSRIEVLPALDVMPYYGLSPHKKILLRLQRVLYLLVTRQLDFLIVPKRALFRRLVPKEWFTLHSLRIEKGDVLDRDEFIKQLITMGYDRETVVEDPGQFAVRGDIIDVFSAQSDHPVRISLFDIEVEEIKFFDAATQRTNASTSFYSVIPAKEVLIDYLLQTEAVEAEKQSERDLKIKAHVKDGWESELKKRADKKDILKTKRDQVEDFIENKIYFHGIEYFLPLFFKKLSSLFDYISKDAVIIDCLEEDCQKELAAYHREMKILYEESEHIESIFTPQDIYITPSELKEMGNLYNHVYAFGSDSGDRHIIDGKTVSNLALKAKLNAKISELHSLAPLASELNEKRKEGIQCYIVCQNQLQLDRVKDLLSRFELPIKEGDGEGIEDVLHAQSLSQRLVHLLIGTIHQGFYSESNREWWIAEEEVFGKKTKRSARKKHKTAVFSSFSDLSEGNFVIHMDHGIGIYRGLVKLEYDQNQNDFLLLEYLGEDKLYVPIDKLNRVQRFVAAEGVRPMLDKLGGTSWLKTKTKAKKAARKLAGELLELQAKRQALKGYAFNENEELNQEFAASFEFEETPDQMQAIVDACKDMEQQRPMDRLVCGDVGYGKTEVAMRAAFKAVADQKQVAVLVPTTVLAFQHHVTFSERLKNYPLKIELLSRFRSAKESAEIIAKLKQGEIDIVIGTHRLLSKDIKFRDLGLLVVDEEHRFGVTHKEKIKKIKALVDVLTLTATPIPRTLNFALNGIRDLSIINTPPQDRLAIKTYTCYFDEATIRDVILKELRRGGQIYFVHNRVQSIEKVSTQIAKLVPEAKVRFGHGQMDEHNLEDIMIDFVHHKFDVLVCTTIIESGLDIPNANTMLVNRADNFGLAQLYQLRGRVGRSHHQAYCYLIIPHEDLLTQKARKRLAVIQRFTALGSGFKVASRDLEIRGAGNILGDEQSGHIAAIGYDLYAQLLQQAIQELKDEDIPEDFEPELKFNMPAKIPEGYVSDAHLRLQLYKQISSSEDVEDVEETLEEWQDRFGKLPEDVMNLGHLIKIKIICKKLLVSQIKQTPSSLSFNFHQNHSIDTDLLIDTVKQDPKTFSITRDGQFIVRRNFESLTTMFNTVFEILSQFAINHSQ